MSDLPKSILTKNQKKVVTKTLPNNRQLIIKIRYDDSCGNGHNSFAITADLINTKKHGEAKYEAFGMLHDEIRKHAPELIKYLKWHLTSSDGPMHYLTNSMYHAGDKDYNGLRKGERRQIINGKTKLPAWELVAVGVDGVDISIHELAKYKNSETQPVSPYILEYRPWYSIGEGKEPDLQAARNSAVWPEAELEDFTEEKLKARLPALMEEFKRDMEELGFIY